jgi:hypothetical protein
MRLGGCVDAKLSEFGADVMVQAFEAGVQTCELCGECVG